MIWLLFVLNTQAFGASSIFYSDNGNGTFAVGAEWGETLVGAEEEALKSCKEKGGIKCKSVLSTTTPGCYSFAVSNEGGPLWSVARADTQKKSWDDATKKCLAQQWDGNKNPSGIIGSCVIRKSYCDNSKGFEQDDAAKNPADCVSPPVTCSTPIHYCRCLNQGKPVTTPKELEKYCRMVFC
jgi:hypothetical protein